MSCDRTWCSMKDGIEHDQYHAGPPVDLAGSDGSSKGWWAWLTQDLPSGEVQIVLEGIWANGRGQEVTVTAADLAAILASTSTPEARTALLELVASSGAQVA